VAVAIRRNEKKKSRLVEIIIIGGFLAIVVIWAAFWYDGSRKASCDRSAQGDVSKMGASIERLYNEASDMNCPRPQITQKHIAFLVGPYYGWGGTSRKCAVRVRVQDNEALACSVKGTKHNWGKSRYIYRKDLTTLEDLSPTINYCYGQEYGGRGGACYTSSMIASDCSFELSGTKRGPADEALIASCEATKAENKPKEQAFASLSNKSVNAFALEFYGKAIDGDSNLVFSPLGMFIPLGMAYAGAGRDTKNQMEKVMRLDKFDGDVHSILKALSKELKCAVIRGEGQLDVDSMVGAQEGFEFTPEYKEIIRTSYGIPFNEYGFGKRREKPVQGTQTKPKKSRQDETMERITEGVQSPFTMLVLMNDIYFRGLWKTDLKFDEKNTKQAPFFLLDGNQIQVPTMFTAGGFKYMEEEHFQALELPYQGEEVSMVVFLPREKKGLLEFEKQITQENLFQWVAKMDVWPYGVLVYLPKFMMSFDLDLIPSLQSMGMKDAFCGRLPNGSPVNCGKRAEFKLADFTGMTGPRVNPDIPDPFRDLYISHSEQKVWIEVNEEGTEAFARSIDCASIEGSEGGPSPPKPEPKIFKADHPFLFVVRHIPTGCILFMGRLTTPL
jgi:serpin B